MLNTEHVVLCADAMNLCLSLITQGMEDTAFGILQSFPVLHGAGPTTDSPTLGSFFLRHCVHMDMVRPHADMGPRPGDVHLYGRPPKINLNAAVCKLERIPQSLIKV